MAATVRCVGMAVWDRILSVPRLPAAATKLSATDLRETGGGPAATAACAVARLGGRARLVARAGDDATGTQIARELREDFAVDTSLLRLPPGARSASSTVAVDLSGECLILASPGERLAVAPDWVEWGAALAGVGCVLANMGWPEAAARAFTEARARGIPSVPDADLAPHAESRALVPLADHAVFSEARLRAVSGEADPRAALAALPMRRSLGVTLGARGHLWRDVAGWHEAAAPAVAVVDTLGAGDVFHGACALALAEGRGLAEAEAEAARFANTAAALKCARVGGRMGAPWRAEVEALLR